MTQLTRQSLMQSQSRHSSNLTLALSSDTIFTLIFLSIFNPTSFTFSTTPFSLCLHFSCYPLFHAYSHSQTDNKNTFNWYNWSPTTPSTWLPTSQNSPCSSSPTQSCPGTLLATLSCSHSSKFQTSQAQSMSRSASTT